MVHCHTQHRAAQPQSVPIATTSGAKHLKALNYEHVLRQHRPTSQVYTAVGRYIDGPTCSTFLARAVSSNRRMPRCRRTTTVFHSGIHTAGRPARALQLVLRIARASVWGCPSNRNHVQEATLTTPQCRRSRQSSRTHRRLSIRHRHRLVVLLLLQWQPKQSQRSLPGALWVARQKCLRLEEESSLHHRVQPASLTCSHHLTIAGQMMLRP